MICWFVNTLICSLYKKEYEKYTSCKNIKEVQEEKLKEILEKNKNTLYGKKYNFSEIKTPEEYREKVPLTNYEDYLEYIELIKNGEKNILTKEEIILLEPTSGSTSSSKLIPYTEGLKREFQAGIKPWIYSLYNNFPEIKKGKSYWSVTPMATEKKYTSGGIPIGFEEDSEYFGKIENYLMDIIFASPKNIKLEKNMDNFYLKTAVKLLETKNLSLISVWSPSFLLLLIQYIEKNKEKLLKKISFRRRKNIEKYLINGEYSEVWKELKVISCWGDGNAARYINDLKNIFKTAAIQPKGILATEGFLSFPIGDEEGSRISYYSHFFEFIEMETRDVKLAYQLEAGKNYEIVLTTSGGLYRYCIGDIITVTTVKNGNPVIRFSGRKGIVSDLFGEKISEEFAAKIYEELKAQYFMLTPEKNRYRLYLKSQWKISNLKIDEMFRRNFHYDYCRKLGQLKEIEVFILTGEPEKEYTEYCLKKGQRLGDIKLKILSLENGWDKVYTGYLQKGEK